ncbi:MAG: hypothetical protein JWN71_979 [Xanthobacteraceae bacterium]|nr:hypothetical protein [Xanthobacteraceae bacterium]
MLALLTFVFGVYQFYQSNLDKKRERAIAQVERFQQFASSDQAQAIARLSEKGDGNAYDLTKFSDPSSGPSRTALLNYFNLAESISYLYNVNAVDHAFIEGNLLCVFVRNYRLFVLGHTGNHGVVVKLIDNAGVFRQDRFENYAKLFRKWDAMLFAGQTVDQRCALNWSH